MRRALLRFRSPCHSAAAPLRSDVTIVGGGAVGLACGRSFAQSGRDVLLLEAEARHGTVTSSRNSEVIHAGLYYKPGSAKARLCVEGRDLLLQLCRDRHIPMKQCGKLVVASSHESDALDRLLAVTQQNKAGVNRISVRAAREMEPQLSSSITAALHSPLTAVFDSHTYCDVLLSDLEDAGGLVATRTVAVAAAVLDRDRTLLLTAAAPPPSQALYVEVAQPHATPLAAATSQHLTSRNSSAKVSPLSIALRCIPPLADHDGTTEWPQWDVNATPPRLFVGPAHHPPPSPPGRYPPSASTPSPNDPSFQESQPTAPNPHILHPAADVGIVTSTVLVNAGGLHAPLLALHTVDLTASRKGVGRQGSVLGKRRVGVCRGTYFEVNGRRPFSRLVYPMPTGASLGLHYTVDVGGGGRFGPDVCWLGAVGEDGEVVYRPPLRGGVGGGREGESLSSPVEARHQPLPPLAVGGGGAAGISPTSWSVEDTRDVELLCGGGWMNEAATHVRTSPPGNFELASDDAPYMSSGFGDRVIEATTSSGERVCVRKVYVNVPSACYSIPTAPIVSAGGIMGGSYQADGVLEAIGSYWGGVYERVGGTPPPAGGLSSTPRGERGGTPQGVGRGTGVGALSATYVGLRPKLCTPGEGAADFECVWSGGGAMATLLGIESPGLTSSLAIANVVANRWGEPL